MAITLIQGAGVHCPSPRMVTYSRPSAAKPPRPLKNSRSGRGGKTSNDFVAGGRRAQWNQSALGSRLTYDLLGQGPAAAQEHSPCGGLEQGAILGRNEISAQNKHVARTVHAPHAASVIGWCGPVPPKRPGDLERRTGPVRSGSRDRLPAASSASIRGREGVVGRFLDPRVRRCGPEQSACRRKFRAARVPRAPGYCV